MALRSTVVVLVASMALACGGGGSDGSGSGSGSASDTSGGTSTTSPMTSEGTVATSAATGGATTGGMTSAEATAETTAGMTSVAETTEGMTTATETTEGGMTTAGETEGGVCSGLDEQECTNNPECMPISGSPVVMMNGGFCLDPMEYIECQPVMGCGDAITHACEGNGTTVYEFLDTCIPQDWILCDPPPVDLEDC